MIDEVINSSRIDFEEAGVNASTLDDLKKVSIPVLGVGWLWRFFGGRGGLCFFFSCFLSVLMGSPRKGGGRGGGAPWASFVAGFGWWEALAGLRAAVASSSPCPTRHFYSDCVRGRGLASLMMDAHAQSLRQLILPFRALLASRRGAISRPPQYP